MTEEKQITVIWSSEQLKEALLVEVNPGISTGKVQFNSKNIEKGDLFIALKGQRDGHEFVADALERGAAAAIVSADVPAVDKSRLIKVSDTMDALGVLAEYKRHKSKAKFIAVTGSAGKTSTKEAIRTMLTAYGKTHANHGTFNNSLGVALTLASLPDDADYVIIEVGMNAAGELSQLINQVLPDIAVITTISEGHIEFFNSVTEIADAKCEIFEGLDINDGIAIINRDIGTYERCIQNIDTVGIQNIKTFGKRIDSNVRFISHELLEEHMTRLHYNVDGEEVEIAMEMIPIHLAENFAASFAVVSALKLDIEPAASAICLYKTVLGRGNLVELNKEGKSYKIICDYYNSNPQSLKASLEYLAQMGDDNKIAILGDMGELGKKSASLHQQMVPYIKDSGISKLFLVGAAMAKLKNDFAKDIMVECYPDVDKLIAEIDQYIQGGELILIKGSKSMNLYKLAQHLGVCNVL